MAKKSQPKAKSGKPTWRKLSGDRDERIRSFPSWPSPLSLRPDGDLMDDYVAGDPAAIAIIDAYAKLYWPCSSSKVAA
jgi:hypothetical protein